MRLTYSVVGSLRNRQKQENPNGKKQVIHRFTHGGRDAKQACSW